MEFKFTLEGLFEPQVPRGNEMITLRIFKICLFLPLEERKEVRVDAYTLDVIPDKPTTEKEKGIWSMYEQVV